MTSASAAAMKDREVMAALERGGGRPAPRGARGRGGGRGGGGGAALMEKAEALNDEAFDLKEQAEELADQARALEARTLAKADPRWLELHLARSDRRQIALSL